jgi:hypothetical protein
MLSVDLTPEETTILRDILQMNISDLGMEIAGTDSQDFRDGLKERRRVLQKVLDALAGPPSAGAVPPP